MDLQHKNVLLAMAVVGIVVIGLSLGSWEQSKGLSTPYPIAIPVLSGCTPFLVLGLIVLSKSHSVVVESRLALALLMFSAYCATSFPLVLATLSAVFAIRSDLRTCSSETQWAHMFSRKDESAIRSIQDLLHCCGFNSVHDRAWPFPSRNNDARTCERTQGYVISCAEMWAKHTANAAFLGGLACLLNVLLLACITAIFLKRIRPQESSATAREPDVQSRLLVDRNNDESEEDPLEHVPETYEEERRREAQRRLQIHEGR